MYLNYETETEIDFKILVKNKLNTNLVLCKIELILE